MISTTYLPIVTLLVTYLVYYLFITIIIIIIIFFIMGDYLPVEEDFMQWSAGKPLATELLHMS